MVLTDSDLPEARTRRTPLPWALLVASVLFSLAVGLLVAWWVVSSAQDADGISPDQMLGGEPTATVSVEGSAQVGEAAPTASYTYLDGSTGSLSDFRGSTILLNFWGSTCAPCLREMPALERINGDLGAMLTVLGVDVSDGLEAGRKMAQRTGTSYPHIRDPKGELMAAFRGTRLPHTVIIDPSGTVIAMEDGAQSEAEFRELVGEG
jgi:thiol-disulfide isomerase/thioredoxin